MRAQTLAAGGLPPASISMVAAAPFAGFASILKPVAASQPVRQKQTWNGCSQNRMSLHSIII